MDGVTLREASEDLPALIERVERGEEVVITRDGRPVARLVPEAAPERTGRRKRTPEQEQALAESIALAMKPRQRASWKFDRNELYDDRG